MSTFITRPAAFVKTHRASTIAAVILILLVGAAIWRWASSETAAETVLAPRAVKVASVAELMSGASGLSVVGTVESKSEAKVSPEAAGNIVRVNASLGSHVAAGSVIAEIENSSQRAAVLQAEGSLDAAKAAVPNLASSLASAQGSSVSTLLTAYAAVESALRDAVDPLFSEPNSSTPVFSVVVTTDSQSRSTLENTRPQFNDIIAREKMQASHVNTDADLASELSRTEEEVRTMRNYTDLLIKALNASVESPDASESDIAAYKASAASARASLTTSLTSLTSARNSLEVASNNAAASGAPSSQEAALKQAEGAYNAALANLEKTRIRAPISGTINSFSLKLGDTVSPGQQVAVISNNGALEIVAYVTESDRERIVVGSDVSIEGGLTGTITKIAPALDPATRKIEVRIGLPADASKTLVNGEAVRVEFAAHAAATGNGPLRIPIAALRIETGRTYVFGVSPDSTLTAIPISIGALTGDAVTVESGLSVDSRIVSDARGLKEGDTVQVQ